MADTRYFYRPGVGYLLEFAPHWGLALALCHFEENASLHVLFIFGAFYVRLPNFCWREVPDGEMMTKWGVSWPWEADFQSAALFLDWGKHSKIIYMPWELTFIRSDVLLADGTWHREDRSNADPPNRFQETHAYTYTLSSGEKQYRQATITVGEREWRQKWLRWCPWFATVRRSIDVTFDDEVGERSGSWKGGTIGCGYDMLPGETPLACLRRMESERKFR